MMRRLIPLLVIAAVLAAFGWTLVFLYRKSQARPIIYSTVQPETRDIVRKAVAPGALVPRREITIKPRVSGILEKLYVEPGQNVKRNALLGRIQIIPNVVNLNRAESDLRAAELRLETAEREMERVRKLREQNLVSEADFVAQELSFKLRKEEVEAAKNNLHLVREGASKSSGKVSNQVYSTVDGMVLEVPVKEGASVIEANNFNEGTTIAAIADMNDVIFQGRVDESEVGALRVGMAVSISVGALSDHRFDGTLEFIAPKGVAKEGTIEFEVRARVNLESDVVVRANYSANADIILERRDGVPAISESLVEYEGEKAFVEIEVAPQRFERRAISLGLSDGLWVEVKSGLDLGSRIKQQDPGSAATPGTATRP
ncbi:MAG: efflux RND transporter periplasmic adaptor subunit [Polyangiaceae bacterium]|nr:efflux RND transporter periplasmic adaptor subunit [Polyangiaceae bacterium]